MQGFKPAFSGVFPEQAGFLLPVSLPEQFCSLSEIISLGKGADSLQTQQEVAPDIFLFNEKCYRHRSNPRLFHANY